MSIAGEEYVIAPWGERECETTVCTVELPSRELIVQLEAPTAVLERMEQLAEKYDITVERALAERLELNRARTSVAAAAAVDDTEEIKHHLTDAREYLSGVEELPTAELEIEIEQIWTRELQ